MLAAAGKAGFKVEGRGTGLDSDDAKYCKTITPNEWEAHKRSLPEAVGGGDVLRSQRAAKADEALSPAVAMGRHGKPWDAMGILLTYPMLFIIMRRLRETSPAVIPRS